MSCKNLILTILIIAFWTKGTLSLTSSKDIKGDNRGTLLDSNLVILQMGGSKFHHQNQNHQNRVKRSSNREHVWPNETISYEIVGWGEDDLEVIHDAMDEISEKTCVKFVPRKNQDNYVVIKRNGILGSCGSEVGMIGNGSQKLVMATICLDKGIVMHELIHSIGLSHEQSRWDRDDFVFINFTNILESAKHNYAKQYENWSFYGIPYDFDSIMHYPAYGFAIDENYPTLIPKNGVSLNRIGQRIKLSILDIIKIKRMYCCDC